MWLVVIGPLLAGIGLLAIGIDWPAVIAAAGKAANGGATTPPRFSEQIEAASPNLGAALGLAVGALVWAMLAALLLYPVFQAMVLRWWDVGPALRRGRP